MTAALRVRQVRKAFGSNDGDVEVLTGVDLDVEPGRLVALVGPSGCGKTTLLRLVAGFDRVDAGTVEVDGHVVAGPGVHLPPERRRIGVVPQEGAVFPHLSVRANVAFGLARPQRRAGRVEQMLALVGLDAHADRMPHELSGGQLQRVALARALAPGPSVVLLDEPFAALDTGLRAAVRAEVRRVVRAAGATVLLVTHDQEEALSMSDRVVVMRDGDIEQIGSPRDVYERPRNLFVARFVGEINVFDLRVREVLADGRLEGDIEGRSVTLTRQRESFVPGDLVHVLLRPEDLRLLPPHSAEGFPGEVIERNYKGMTLDSVVRLESGLQLLASEFFDEEDPDFDYRLGEKVRVTWVPNWEIVLAHEAASAV
jgi:spermidine/putrescine transport system ATP-binding protein